MAEEKACRLRIGGLSPNISDKELKKRFKLFGRVSGVWREEEGDAIVELVSNSGQLQSCVSHYHKTSWKGHRLSVRLEGGALARGGSEQKQSRQSGKRRDTDCHDKVSSDDVGKYSKDNSTISPKKRVREDPRPQSSQQPPKLSKSATATSGTANQSSSSSEKKSDRSHGDVSVVLPNGTTSEDPAGRLSSDEGDILRRSLFTSDGEEEEELIHQLKEEKSKALSILDSVLGTHPRSSANIIAEEDLLPHRVKGRRDVGKASIPESGKKGETTVVPGERYFSVTSDLKDLFGRDVPHTFDFEADSETQSEIEEEISVRHSPKELPHKTYHKTKETNVEHVHKKPPKSFYFHSGNGALENRLCENWFYRPCPLDELESGWAERRAAMKHSYKGRHRDALRMARKSKKTKYTSRS